MRTMCLTMDDTFKDIKQFLDERGFVLEDKKNGGYVVYKRYKTHIAYLKTFGGDLSQLITFANRYL